jgi:hypothetical protein
MPDDEPRLTDEEQRHYAEGLDALPLLTRTVFLLASRDSFPYAEIGWRCGISIEEVQVRVADALLDVTRHMHGRPTFTGRIRRALLPWRDGWAAARMREGDRRLAPWLSLENRPGRRGVIDWIAWAFEHVLR